MSSTKLLATLAKIDNNNFDLDINNLIAIDTSNNRLGINTLDPSYSIDVLGNEDISGIIRCDNIICNDISLNNFNIINLFKATKSMFNDMSNQSGLIDNSNNIIYNIFKS